MSFAEDYLAKPWPRAEKRGWYGNEVSKGALTVTFERPQLKALRALTSRIAESGMEMKSITRSDFAHTDLDMVLGEALDRLKTGIGLVFLSGIDVGDYSTEELRILYWGLSTHFGRALSQSKYGDMMGEVTPVAGRENAKRGYVLDRELGFHTDHSEIFTLFCIVDALEGGENVFASSLKVYEIIQNERPEYIPILERGWRQWLVDEQPDGTPSVTPHRVPAFSSSEGVVSHFAATGTIELTYAALGESLTDEERAAIKFLSAVRQRPELHFTVGLEPGEAVFINNFEVLHSRRAFTHRPDRKRHLLRLWLEGEERRPMVPALPLYRFMNRDGSQGINEIPESERGPQEARCKEDQVSRYIHQNLVLP